MQATVYPFVHRLTVPIQPLDIPVHCIHGIGVPTEESYHYDTPAFSGAAPNEPNKMTQGDGDGTVNLASLESCKQYARAFLAYLSEG